MPELPIIEARDQDAWRAWLLDNHAAHDAVWLKLAKKVLAPALGHPG
jgi:hypothetical protein